MPFNKSNYNTYIQTFRVAIIYIQYKTELFTNILSINVTLVGESELAIPTLIIIKKGKYSSFLICLCWLLWVDIHVRRMS